MQWGEDSSCLSPDGGGLPLIVRPLVHRTELTMRSSQASMPSRDHLQRAPVRTSPAALPTPGAGPSPEMATPLPVASPLPPIPEVQLFLDFARVEKGLAANSIESYRRDLTEFSAFLQRLGKSPSAVDRDDIRAFLKELYDRGLGARSVARHLVSLRNLFRFLVREGRLTGDPTVDVEAPKLDQSLPKYLTAEEVDQLLAQPDVSTPLGNSRQSHAGIALRHRNARFGTCACGRSGFRYGAWHHSLPGKGQQGTPDSENQQKQEDKTC